MTDQTDIVKQGMLARLIEMGDEFRALGPAIDRHKAEIERLEKRKTEVGKLGQALIDAAKAFDFDLLAAYHAKTGRKVEAAPQAAEAGNDQPRRLSIKKFVEKAAEAAYPQPVRAATIRADLAAQGEDIHEKTVGMTLYRLLKKGLLRREGFDWYFVPENERTAQTEGAEA